MNLSLVVFVFVAVGYAAAQDFNCKPFTASSPSHSETVCFDSTCVERMKEQVAEELNAAFHYLYMAAHFDQESVHRHGLAGFMYHSASEEREHGKMFMGYLDMRGAIFDKPYSINHKDISIPADLTYLNALKTALNMEIKVTDMINNITRECVEDFHAVDELTDPILAEQHTGIRKLQGFIKEFEGMLLGATDSSDLALAEYIFDHKLDNGY